MQIDFSPSDLLSPFSEVDTIPCFLSIYYLTDKSEVRFSLFLILKKIYLFTYLFLCLDSCLYLRIPNVYSCEIDVSCRENIVVEELF